MIDNSYHVARPMLPKVLSVLAAYYKGLLNHLNLYAFVEQVYLNYYSYVGITLKYTESTLKYICWICIDWLTSILVTWSIDE